METAESSEQPNLAGFMFGGSHRPANLRERPAHELTLRPIKPLEGHEDFDVWLYRVKLQLRIESTEGLKKLIDGSITRDGQAWHIWATDFHSYQQYSERVAMWLASNLSDNVIRAMEADPERPVFADDFIAKIERVVFRFAYNNPGLVYEDALGVKRYEYDSIEHFVEALKSKVALSNKVNEASNHIAPALALVLLFNGIDKEMPKYVREKIPTLLVDDSDSFEMEAFLSTCDEVVDQAKARNPTQYPEHFGHTYPGFVFNDIQQ
ncbi:hypothetical protein BJY00DRAFT_282000 [Aspergillus carlsbadensis]|nr:hypothetical protein BJY00DRAFT_282000 [Aspergillus carlsbadensis]